MKKLLIGLGAVVAVCVVALVVASFHLGSIVKAAVNTYGPRFTDTRVSLAGASISPFSGSGTLRGFEIGNPRGWSNADLASLGSLHISVVPKSLVADHIVINDIDINAPEFDYETKLVSSNVGDLMANINRASGSSAPSPKAKNGKPIRFEVRHFRLHDGVVRLGTGAAAVKIPLPPIELTDIGTKEGGITPSQLVATVMRSVTDDIVSAATQAAAKAAGASKADATKALDEAKSKVKNLLGGKK